MSIFSSVKARKPKRSKFDLSHEHKFTCSMGELIPFYCEDVIPGDSFKISTSSLVRLAPMIAPMMQNVRVETHFFFVPNRLIWEDWEKFITKGVDGTDTPVTPHFVAPYFNKGSVGDYLGLPVGVTLPNTSSLPFRAYRLIWNEYFRDQNLQDPLPLPLTSGAESELSLADLNSRCWTKDYFTSALPWTQRGPEVRLPIGTKVPVMAEVPSSLNTPIFRKLKDDSFAENTTLSQRPGAGVPFPRLTMTGYEDNVYYDPNGTLVADLSEATATTINELRRSIALQQWLERNARSGARYKEQILAHFGVISPDSRLQRPEFLGSTRTPIIVSEVLQTSATDSMSPQANMAGHGISAPGGKECSAFFNEHGWIIGLLSIIPDASYYQGLPRRYTRFDNMDYAFPEFAHLGEQPIYNKEIFAKDLVNADKIFGYTPRYAEYKYRPSLISGEFRSSLEFWHLGRKFENAPQLNSDFVTCKPSQRVFAVNDDSDKFWIQSFFHVTAKRPLPYYGTPAII